MSKGKEKALEDGWVEKAEWVEQGKAEEDWVDYQEFNLRGELMGRISSQSRQLKSMQSELHGTRQELNKAVDTLKAFGEHHRKMMEKRLSDELKSLRRVRADAMKEGDTETLAAVEEDIDLVKAQQDDLVKQAEAEEEALREETPQPVVNWTEAEYLRELGAWKERNPWYDANKDMQDFAEFLVRTQRVDFQNKSAEEFLNEVAEETLKKFSGDAPAPRRGPSEGDTQSSSVGGKKYTLSEQERQFGEEFVRQGLFDSLDDYAKELAQGEA